MAEGKKGLSLSESWDAALESTGIELDDKPDGDLFEPFPEPEVEEVEDSTDSEDDVVDENNQDDSTTDNDESEDEEISLANLELGDEQPEEDSSEESPTVDLASKVKLPNGDEVTLQELIEGNMRQSDYTQKTQALAEDRKFIESPEFAKVRDLFGLLQEDTVGTVQRLAVEVGLLDADVEPTGKLPTKTAGLSDEQIAELVNSKVQEALQERPEVKEYEQRQAVARIQAEFDRLEKAYGVELSDPVRLNVLENVERTGSNNIELTFLQMQRQLDNVKAEKSRVQGSSTKTSRTGSKPVKPRPKRARSITEAYNNALASLED